MRRTRCATNAVVPAVLARAVAAGRRRGWCTSAPTTSSTGTATTPYPEDAPTAPRSAYGRTKAAGEEAVRAALPDAHLVVRTAWLYGAHGGCFPSTIARVAREKGEVSVVDDQVGQPTWTVRRRRPGRAPGRGARRPAGTYHATSSGQCSWFDFAREVVAAAGLDPAIGAARRRATAFVRPAPRPAYSVLGHDALVRRRRRADRRLAASGGGSPPGACSAPSEQAAAGSRRSPTCAASRRARAARRR